jgi:isoaspartyl peptidase/L-asparaginase-like protein (Ntn-hydrolase superfamily)
MTWLPDGGLLRWQVLEGLAVPAGSAKVNRMEGKARRTQMGWALALHGGAGPVGGRSYEAEEAHMGLLLQQGADMLDDGASALDVVTAMVRELEECGLHVAGRGASPNTAGEWELDAAIMDRCAGRAQWRLSSVSGHPSSAHVP